MSCRHCELIRDEQRQFLDRHGQCRFDAWVYGWEYDEPVVDVDGHAGPDLEGPRRHIVVPSVALPRWTTFPLSELVGCGCDCHIVARICGALPRLPCPST